MGAQSGYRMPRFVHTIRGQREEVDRVVLGCAAQRGHEESGGKLSECTAALTDSLTGLVLDSNSQKVSKYVSGAAGGLDVSVHMAGAATSDREAVENVTSAILREKQVVEGKMGQLEEVGGGLNGRLNGTLASKVEVGGTVSLDQGVGVREIDEVVDIPESTLLSIVNDCSCIESIGQLGKCGVNAGSDGVQVDVSSTEEVFGSSATIRKRGQRWKRLAREVGTNRPSKP